MDRFLCTELSNEDKLDQEYKTLIIDELKKNKIDQYEYSYIMDYLENKGTIINSVRYIAILNKLQNVKLYELSIKLFPNFFIYNKTDNILQSKTESLKNIIVLEKDKYIKFTKDQLKAISNIFKFLPNYNLRSYGLYGYAGTGKTTIIVEMIAFLLEKKIIKSVTFAAPTNQAVMVMKSKFRCYVKKIYDQHFDSNISKNFNIDKILDTLYERGIRIDFMTIHKLLQIEKDVNIEGENVFTKTKTGSLISNFELVVVDECSMIPINLAEYMFNEIRAYTNDRTQNYKKMPKIIFLGDPAQLPPVKERSSIVFSDIANSVSFDEYKKHLIVIEQESNDPFFKGVQNDLLRAKYYTLINDITNMPTITLKKVMRSNRKEVVKICYQFRLWALDEIKVPKLMKYVKNHVSAYSYVKGTSKIKSDWFKRCLNYYKNGNNCNILLTWRNDQSREYNNAIRSELFKYSKLSRFMVGDILILGEFYNIDDGQVTYIGDYDDDVKEKKFYTSEQIKITKIEQTIKKVPKFKEELNRKALKLKNGNVYESKYLECVKRLNELTSRSYLCWKLHVVRVGDILSEGASNSEIIYVVHENEEKKFNDEKLFIKLEIGNLVKMFRDKFGNKMSSVETNIIKPLWFEVRANLESPFANVSYGYSITCHKGQGSNFFNVFVDIDDILKNSKLDEAKKCLYTAVTRTSNELILLS